VDIINRIIESMTKEELRFFKIYISRNTAEGGRKDVILFDYIRKKGEDYDEDKAALKLYPDGEKNSFYRLKNRMTEEVNKSLMLQHFGEDEASNTLQLISLAYLFFNRNNYPVAYHFIRKAEKKATAQENYELLDIIYSEYIKLSHEMVSINPETYIKLRKENSTRLHNLRQIDDVLAAVKYKLKITQNFSPGENPVVEMLSKTVDDFSHDSELKKSPALRFKMYQAVSQVLLQRHDYKNLEDYLLTTYTQFTEEHLFNKGNHLTKLQMLTYSVNTLFKNGKIQESLSYAEKLKAAMEEFGKLHYDKYLFFYYNSLVINYSKIDIDKAIEILEQLENNEQLKNTPFYEVFVYLNLAIFRFEKGDYRNSIKNLNKLFIHESYKNADRSLRFRIAIAELIIRLELDDMEFLDYRTTQIKKEFKDLLQNEENKREQKLVEIIRYISLHGVSKKDKKLNNSVSQFLKEEQLTSSDTDVINYNKWLKSKFQA
jgi:hypothetical protein